MKMGLEREALYAMEYPFIDYGADLQIMSKLEQGVQLKRIFRSEYDAKSIVNDQEPEDYLNKMKCRKSDKLPEKFVGKGPRGYLLYDFV